VNSSAASLPGSLNPGQAKECTVLVFDLDDTLYPECDYVRSGFAAVDQWLRKERRADGFEKAACDQFDAGRRGTIFNVALEAIGVDPEPGLISTLVSVYREHQPRLALHPDAAWALEYYRASVTMGILTDGYLVTQRSKVASLSLENKVDAIIYSDAYGREHWKPSTIPFCKMVDTLGCEHTRCVYVADNPEKDFVAPRMLGWRTIQIMRANGEYCHREVPESYRAETTISSLHELREILP
jgi:putative hydrolase of the HAD superfamily